MNTRDSLQLFLFLALLAATARPLGLYLGRVFDGERTWLSWGLAPLERLIYRLGGIDPQTEMSWGTYARQLMGFSAVSVAATYAALRLQPPQPLSPHLAFNTAVSFATNTNWQSYAGETTMSYLSQLGPLVLQNFVSAAVGLAVAIAIIRALSRSKLGNFWVDLVRAHLYVLLPLSLVFALFLISQGMIQNFLPTQEILTLEGVKQFIAQGPVASQVAIKMLGTNGGGYFNANAAHPYENPTALSNFMQMLAIFLIPSALVYLLGHQTGHRRHGWSVWAAMAIVFTAGTLICAQAEYRGNPAFTQAGLSSPANLEGKEARFGIFNSALFATVTTDASCGAVNSMHDSFTPLGGLVPLVNIQLGELIFGGVGSGLYGMLLYILLTVFIAGLLVGRTPEYLGKKVEGREIKYAMIAIIVMALSILGLSALAAVSPSGVGGLANAGPHGLTEILYAYTSAAGNNGSAFAGLSANVPFWNLTLAIAMFAGRYFVMIPMLALAGSFAAKKTVLQGESAFPVHGPLFILLLIGVIFLVGALTFFPALALGPVIEHFEMLRGRVF